jgi:ABC-type amino acid transport substrate-binding protein
MPASLFSNPSNGNLLFTLNSEFAQVDRSLLRQRKAMRFLLTALAVGSILVGSLGESRAQQQDTLLQQINKNGLVRVCQAPYPPYNVKNPQSGEWEGLNVDIVKEIAAFLSVKIENVDSSFSTLIPSLLTHKCDISAAATYVTPARAEQVLFTTPYAQDTKVAFVPVDSPFKTYADLDKPNVTIVTRSGTAEETFAKRFFKQAKIKLTTSDATQAHLLDVAAGRSDAGFAGRTGGLIFLKQNPNIKLRMIEDKELDPSRFALMLPAGEYQLQQYLNISLQALKDSGKLEEITSHWLN